MRKRMYDGRDEGKRKGSRVQPFLNHMSKGQCVLISFLHKTTRSSMLFFGQFGSGEQ